MDWRNLYEWDGMNVLYGLEQINWMVRKGQMNWMGYKCELDGIEGIDGFDGIEGIDGLDGMIDGLNGLEYDKLDEQYELDGLKKIVNVFNWYKNNEENLLGFCHFHNSLGWDKLLALGTSTDVYSK